MAYLYKTLKEDPALEDDLELSLTFFFHRRGIDLQRSFRGMLRALLCQVYKTFSSTRKPILDIFRARVVFGKAGKDWEWQMKELHDLLFNAILSISRKVIIFIDALDEAGEDAQEIAEYFHLLGDEINQRSLPIKICLSCRHYPIVATAVSLDVCVEKHNSRDISTYVRDRLSSSIEDAESLTNLEQRITEKALGVFQWARLLVPRVASWYRAGESLYDIQMMLAKVPSELKGVYQNILESVVSPRHRPKTLHLMQWVCFAERPLSLTELRVALVAEMCNSVSSRCYEDVEEFIESDARMEKQVISLSGGLIEVQHHDSSTIVQPIHQSVNDYLLCSGLILLVSLVGQIESQGLLQPDNISVDQLIGRSQDRLAKACVAFFNSKEVAHLAASDEIQQLPLLEQWVHAYSVHDTLQRQCSFLIYATEFCFLHAKKAESHGYSQVYITQEFNSTGRGFRAWLATYHTQRHRMKSPEYQFSAGSTLLHVASSFNLCSVVQGLLKSGTSVDEKDAANNTSLHYAARGGFNELLSTLLHADADISAHNMDGDADLTLAAAKGHTNAVAMLLRLGANVNEAGAHLDKGTSIISKGESPLQAAIRGGSRVLVQMLLDSGADVNAQGGYYGNALQTASYLGLQDIVQLLLSKGAKVNAQGGFNGNALQAALYGEHNAIAEILLDKGADVNAQGGTYGNALQTACRSGNKAIVQLLLEKGADVNAQGGIYGNALQAACHSGIMAIVQLLLHHGAKTNASGGYYGDALQAASYRGHNATI